MRRFLPVLLACWLLAACAAARQIGTTVRYDRFADKTTALVGDFPVDPLTTLQVGASLKGHDLREPDAVTFVFTIYREANEMTPFDRVFFLIDGERQDYPTTRQNREIYANFKRRNAENLVDHVAYSRLLVSVMIPFADFVKMADANSLELRLSSRAYTVPPEWRLVFRQLVDHLKSGGQTPPPAWQPPAGKAVQPE